MPAKKKKSSFHAKKKASSDNKLENEIQQVLENERRIAREEKRIEKNELEIKTAQQKELNEERKIEKDDVLEKKELQKIEKIESDLKKGRGTILRRITYHDFIKSAIGAFAGIVSGFAFAFSSDLFIDLSVMRAYFLYLLSFIIVLAFVYFSGFRKVKEIRNMRLLPLRAFVIYFTALFTVVLVFLIFGFIGRFSFVDLFKLVSATMILAVLGACAADMIGGG